MSRPLWQPMHRLPSFRASYVVNSKHCEDLYQMALSLPCSVGLTQADQDHVASFLTGSV